MKLWVPPERKVAGGLPFYSMDFGAGDRAVLSLFRDGGLIAAFDAPTLRNGDVVKMQAVRGDVQVSVNGSRIAHWSEYAHAGRRG